MPGRRAAREMRALAALALSALCAAALLCAGRGAPRGAAELAQTAGAAELAADLRRDGSGGGGSALGDGGMRAASALAAAGPAAAHGPADMRMTPAERALAALKDTHLFWGPALQLDSDDGTGKPQAWRDSDYNLQAVADDALAFCDELRDQEEGGEEAVAGQGQGRKRRCVHRVVSPRDTRFTHTPAGINDWTQPLQNEDMDGEGVGPEHNSAVTLMRVVDAFKPRTSWHGHQIYTDGVIVGIPTYDRAKYRGFRGASREANLLFDTSAGNRKFGDYTLDSDADRSGDEAYDQLALDAEAMIRGNKPRPGPAAHKPAPSAKKAAARRAPRHTSLVKQKFGKFTIWKHQAAPPPPPPAQATTLRDPLMAQAMRASRGRRREVTRLYGPDAPRVQSEARAAAQDRQLRLQRLWEVTDNINVGATPPIPAASVVTQTQSVVVPGAQLMAPPVGSNGFAMVQPYPLPSPTQPSPQLGNLMGAAGMWAPAAAMPAAPAPAPAPCGVPNMPACPQGVVVPGASAMVAQPYAGVAQWMQPPPIIYAQQAPPPVYRNTVTSSVTSTTQSPPASVTQVDTVPQPWAADSNLPTDTSIVEDEVEVPEPVDPNKFHVHVEGLPSGCSSVGGAEDWDGQLTVEEVKCPGGAPQSNPNEPTLGGWESGDYVGGWE